MNKSGEHWPVLPLESWQETYETLHLWSQVVGKIRLSHMPSINHSWHVTLYLSSQGFTTSPIPCGSRAFEIQFDLINHRLHIDTSDGENRSFSLYPMSVAEFYRKIMRALSELDLETHIWPVPVEMPGYVKPFSEIEDKASYDAAAVRRYWQAMVNIHRVFTLFRAQFRGKASPVQFFWGSFDLAVTRFSGRVAPTHPGGAFNLADRVMEEAYSHELSSAGFWPGAGLGEAAFYSYAYPEPKGFFEYRAQPDEAYYHKEFGEFILPYEAVRTASDPDAVLIRFLQSTYQAAADLAAWDRSALERHV